jgi:hypothetical protein
MKRHVWTVTLSAKWGGTRHVYVLATTDARARSAARQLARLDETVWDARDSGLTASEHQAKGGTLS